MESQVGRRVFVGSIAAGLPLLATAASRTFAQSPQGATSLHNHSGALLVSPSGNVARGLDPISEEVERQLKLLVPQIRKGKHAAARQVATLLRIGGVHATHTLDDPLKAHLRRAVREYGKNGFLLNHGHSPDKLKKELAEYSLSPEHLPSTSYATKERALDALLTSGLAAYLAQVADVLEVVAAQMEARGPIIPVARRQEPSKCAELWGYVEAAQATVAAVCGTAALFPNPATAGACAFAMGGLSALLVSYGINCFLFG